MNEVFGGFMNDAFSRLLAALYCFGILHSNTRPRFSARNNPQLSALLSNYIYFAFILLSRMAEAGCRYTAGTIDKVDDDVPD
jgi:hypothetical protein